MPSLKKRVRQLAIACARHLPVSSKHFGLPKGVFESSKEYARTTGGAEYRVFRPESICHRQPPQTVDGNVHWKFDGRCEESGPETFLITIPGGRTAGAAGAVITHNDRLLLDVSRDFSGTHHLFKQLTLPRCRKVNGRVAVLASSGGNAFFHWLTDSLPRVEILRRTLPGGLESIDSFVVNSGIPIIQESLSLLGIPAGKIIVADASTHIQADELIVPSLPGISGNPPRWACEFLRETFLPHKADGEFPTRIYVSRANARYRRIVNEDEVRGKLAETGFVPVRLEELSFAEQIALFAAAEAVVAPHGAGLTNLLWCRPGTKVLELFSPNYVNVCFWAVANQVDLDYHFSTGSGDAPPPGTDPHRVQDDINVSLNMLERSLEGMFNR